MVNFFFTGPLSIASEADFWRARIVDTRRIERRTCSNWARLQTDITENATILPHRYEMAVSIGVQRFFQFPVELFILFQVFYSSAAQAFTARLLETKNKIFSEID